MKLHTLVQPKYKLSPGRIFLPGVCPFVLQISVYRFDKEVMHFSCIGKKSAKRSRHRGGADREAYRHIILIQLFSPASSRPHQCTSPGAGRKTGSNRIASHQKVQKLYTVKHRSHSRFLPSCRRGPGGGSGGGRLKVGVEKPVSICSNERLCGQRLPRPLSLVTFLCGHKKVTRSPIGNCTTNINLSKKQRPEFFVRAL